MAKKRLNETVRAGWREFGGILIGTLGLMLLLGMLSFESSQVGDLGSDPVWKSNWVGFFGAKFSYWVLIFWGIAGYGIPLGMMWLGILIILRPHDRILSKALWFFLALLSLSGLLQVNHFLWDGLADRLGIGIPGGGVGNLLAGEHHSLVTLLNPAGTGLLLLIFFGLGVVKMLRVNLIELSTLIWEKIRHFRLETRPSEDVVEEKRGRAERKPKKPEAEPKPKHERKIRKKKEPRVVEAIQEELPDVSIFGALEEPPAETLPVELRSEDPVFEDVFREEPPAPKKLRKKMVKPTPPIEEEEPPMVFRSDEEGEHGDYRLPPLSLLDSAVVQGEGMSAAQVASTAEVLQRALEEFGVEAKVTGVQQGPVVTCYEILPAPGVRVERIKNLSDNLALKMHAESIRIQAPIPGKGVCGVEIPNTERQGVYFREMVESRAFQSGKHALPLLLGKDVNGKSIMHDLAKMPHLLIAGATGAGKSVCMNSILTGLLMKHTPDDMRLILVDPKTVEFHAYNNLPHLVVPVITDAKKVALGLKWAIDEMERRFKWFNQAGVRDLPSFNARVVQKQTELFGEEVESEPRKNEVPDKLPYIVIVIDELADLMHVAQAEIEAGIARLAAKSRAAGIHMILATQRPDVKVITGTIKANFPVRIAFKVSQKVDSRTILDRMGADTLLGKGDMLVLPPGTDKLIRLQGVYTSDDEINNVTNFCKEQSQPEFITEIKEKIDKPVSDLPEMDGGGDEKIVEQAIEVIRQTKRASTSSLQRRLRIGYTRAARVMDLLEEQGVVGPPDGAGPREILIDLDGEIPQNTGVEENATG